MANTFREQAEDRFTRSLAFMSKADSLLQDDLVNRSALADAVSAIKNMLQGYLLLRISETPQSATTQRWQEVAAGNSMPDLMRCCADAGLNLGALAFEIKQLNRERNQRMHDDPGRRIEAQQARKALELARNVQKRIKAAVSGEVASETASQTAAVQRIAAVTRAAVSGRLGRGLLNSVTGAPATAAPVAAGSTTDQAEPHLPTPAPEPEPAQAADARESDEALQTGSQAPDAEAADEPGATRSDAQLHELAPVSDGGVPEDSGSDGDTEGELDGSADTGELEVVTHTRRRRRFALGLLRGLAAAALLIVGVVAGADLTVPVVEGRAPAWLSFASSFVPAVPTATPALPTATAAPTPQDGPLFAGAFMVGAPACLGTGELTLVLHNSATKPALWSAGSPDGSAATFATRASGSGSPTLAGTLASGSSTTVYVTSASGSPYHVVVVAPGGTIQLLAPAC